MAVGKLRYNVLFLQVGLLRVAILYWSVHRSLCIDMVPSLTIRPKSILLDTINGTFDSSITIGCATTSLDAEKATSISEMTLKHETYGTGESKNMVTATSTKKLAALDPAFSLLPLVVSGQIATTVAEPSVFSVSMRAGTATCQDSAWFECILKYTDLTGASVETSDRGLLDVAPTEVHVSRTPTSNITVGMELKLDCVGIIGTIKFEEPAELLWVYTNRESALQNQYSELDQRMSANMKHGTPETVPCSQRQRVSLELTVDEIRDSMRDYYCVVSRVYAKGGEITYVGRGDNKISMPDFSKPKEQAIGIGGFIGIGLACVAFILCVVFVVVWCRRRQLKKTQRKEELDRRKSVIEERRKSIAEFVQQKQNAEPAVEAKPSESGEMTSQSEQDVEEPLEPPTAAEEGSATAAEEGSEAEA